MTNQGWRERLIAAVEASGRAGTAICQAAGMRHAWYSEMMRLPTDPKVDLLLRFINELGVDPAYIFSGVELNPDTSELLRLLAEAPEDLRASMIQLLQRSRQSEK